jgi:hypothetical protein
MYMKTILAFIFSCSLLGIHAQENQDFTNRINTALTDYLETFLPEKVFVQTDKDIYVPSEIIWFNALVMSRSGHKPVNLSPELTVSIYNASGVFITGDKYLIEEGVVNADIRLPDFLSSGRYYLVAYTPLQMNAEDIFIKPLYVDQNYEQDARVFPENPEKIYPSGTDVQVIFNVLQANGQPADRYTFGYQVVHAGKILGEGRARSEGGKAIVQFRTPHETREDPVKIILTHTRNLWTMSYDLKTSADKIKIQFYPEGGYALENIPTKVGYFATAHHSVPISFEADIQDNSGQLVGKTSTFAPGYGLFPFRPEPGKSYRMMITSEYGKGQFFPLPVHQEEKMALAVSRDANHLNADLVFADNLDRQITVAVTEQFNLIWAANYKITKSARIQIPVEDFSPGLQQITIFDQQGKVLANRLVHTQPGKSFYPELKAAISGNQLQGSLNIQGLEIAPGKLTLAVTDQSRISLNRPWIDDYITLEAELKNQAGHIMNISENEANVATAIDFILIANELKAFTWEMAMNTGQHAGQQDFLVKKGVAGLVTSRKGEPVSGVRVDLLNTKDMQMYTATSDANGKFTFPGLNPVDYSEYTITALDSRGRGTFNVTLDPSFSDQIGQVIQKNDGRYATIFPYKPFSPDYLTANPDLVIKAPPIIRPEPPGAKKQRNEAYKTLLQTSTNLADVIKMMKPYTLQNGQIVFHGTQNSFYHQSGALIVLDGQKMGTSADVLNTIPPNDVESINISLDPMDIQKYTGFNSVGVIEIKTKKGNPTGEGKARSIQAQAERLYNNEFRIPRKFSAQARSQSDKGKDLRTTLFWEPGLEPDSKDGVTFTVPLPDINTGFVIDVWGVDSNGRFIKARKLIQP